MENNTKINFFKRIQIAIFKLEEYGVFLGEKLSKSFKYFFLLILLMTIAIVIAGAYNFSKMINTGLDYINKELPEFSYEEGIMKFTSGVDAYDHTYDFKLCINTDDEVPAEKLNLYKNDLSGANAGIILLKDKFIYTAQGISIENTYNEFFSNYNLEISNKKELLNVINDIGIPNLILVYGLTSLLSMYIVNVVTIFMDLLMIAIFGCIAAKLCGLRFKLSPMFTLAIYSMTLSIALSGIYNVVYLITGFYIKYFNIMYLLIAYVYIIAAIFMIKYDLIKQSEELQKIIEVQEQVRKETEEQENDDNNEEKKEEKQEEPPVEEKPEDEEEKEPDGSEI